MAWSSVCARQAADDVRGVSPEWPLVKGSIIAGASFPIAVAVRDFYETMAGLVEQRVGFGPAFYGTRFHSVGAVANQVSHQVEQ